MDSPCIRGFLLDPPCFRGFSIVFVDSACIRGFSVYSYSIHEFFFVIQLYVKYSYLISVCNRAVLSCFESIKLVRSSGMCPAASTLNPASLC